MHHSVVYQNENSLASSTTLHTILKHTGEYCPHSRPIINSRVLNYESDPTRFNVLQYGRCGWNRTN